jgi:thioredoxin 1|tara:strand:- start:2244 stop:2492 length:249 start_codon:yes stop_codon:yes gene_type:complete
MKSIKYFSATWCGPCQSYKPIMEQLSSEGHNIEFIDIDSQEDMARQYNVRSVPTTVIEENGNEISRFIGAQPRSKILESIGK